MSKEIRTKNLGLTLISAQANARFQPDSPNYNCSHWHLHKNSSSSPAVMCTEILFSNREGRHQIGCLLTKLYIDSLDKGHKVIGSGVELSQYLLYPWCLDSSSNWNQYSVWVNWRIVSCHIAYSSPSLEGCWRHCPNSNQMEAWMSATRAKIILIFLELASNFQTYCILFDFSRACGVDVAPPTILLPKVHPRLRRGLEVWDYSRV